MAKNSGGEGFLSGFVILPSLLYYMRKDDTDIFADRNGGKVSGSGGRAVGIGFLMTEEEMRTMSVCWMELRYENCDM